MHKRTRTSTVAALGLFAIVGLVAALTPSIASLNLARAHAGDATLIALTVTADGTAQTLSPIFRSAVYFYTVRVANSVSQVTIEATPYGDIEITFTGLCAGEKLNEELLVGDASFGTEHRKIMRAVESHVPWQELKPALANLEKACDIFDYDAIKTFIEGLVEGADLAEQLFRLPVRANILPLPKNS